MRVCDIGINSVVSFQIYYDGTIIHQKSSISHLVLKKKKSFYRSISSYYQLNAYYIHCTTGSARRKSINIFFFFTIQCTAAERENRTPVISSSYILQHVISSRNKIEIPRNQKRIDSSGDSIHVRSSSATITVEKKERKKKPSHVYTRT